MRRWIFKLSNIGISLTNKVVVQFLDIFDMFFERINGSKYVHHQILLVVILVCIEQHVYIPVQAQFFGTGSSRLEDQTQEIVKEMAQEYKEIIEDKE